MGARVAGPVLGVIGTIFGITGTLIAKMIGAPEIGQPRPKLTDSPPGHLAGGRRSGCFSSIRTEATRSPPALPAADRDRRQA